LFLRVPLGAMYIAHAFYKMFVLTWPGIFHLFTHIGLPIWMAPPTVAAEIVGGICLILGIRVRWVALLLMPTLIGAIAFVHGAHGWMFSNPGGGWEYLAVQLCVSAALVCLGNGALSLESAWLQRRSAVRS